MQPQQNDKKGIGTALCDFRQRHTPPAHHNLGRAHSAKNQLDAAFGEYKKASVVAPFTHSQSVGQVLLPAG